MLNLDEDDFYSSLETISKQLLVLYISAPDCKPCGRMRPIVIKVAKSFAADGVIFANINKRLCPNICSELKADLVPAFYFYRNSKPFAKLVGSRDEDAFRNVISKQANYVAGFGL